MESAGRKIVRHLKIRANVIFGQNASNSRRTWLLRPHIESGDNVCFFATYSPGPSLSDRAARHVAAWRKAGFKVVLIVALENIDQHQIGLPPSASGAMLRENVGYDFAAWATAIKDTLNLKECNAVAIANDSVLGPIGDFSALVRRALATDADIVGLTESAQRRVHLQSYFVIFKKRAVSSGSFASFWASIKNGNRDFVVSRYETLMSDYFRRHGLTTRALFRTPHCTRNPTLDCWRELRDRGFPYLKAALLRGVGFDLEDARPYLSSGEGA